MHSNEVGQREEGIAVKKLDSAARIGAAVGEHPVTNEIGEARRRLARTRPLPACPDACGHGRLAAAIAEKRVEPHDIGRIVLAVAVHGGDDRETRDAHAGPECRALARPVAVLEVAQARMGFEPGFDFCRGPIIAAVIDDDQLAERVRRHGGKGLVDQAPDIAFFIRGRDDDGNGHRRSLFTGAANRRWRLCRNFGTILYPTSLPRRTPQKARMPSHTPRANIADETYLLRLALCLGVLLALRLAA